MIISPRNPHPCILHYPLIHRTARYLRASFASRRIAFCICFCLLHRYLFIRLAMHVYIRRSVRAFCFICLLYASSLSFHHMRDSLFDSHIAIAPHRTAPHRLSVKGECGVNEVLK
jgi:hypothetical protein